MESSKKIVIGNMKMNMTADEVSSYLKKVNNKIGSKRVVLCPTSIYVPYFLCHDYLVGLQNVYCHKSGAYTGEISAVQAASMGVSVVLIGHSERRALFHETDSLIHEKIVSAVEANLKVVLCIGETEVERSMLRTDRVLKRQIKGALSSLSSDMFENIILAYEPVWAIGTGVVPKVSDIKQAVEYIKGVVFEEFGISDIPVLYGGSVNEKNIEKLNRISNLSGFLVGGASNDPEKFKKIIEVAVG